MVATWLSRLPSWIKNMFPRDPWGLTLGGHLWSSLAFSRRQLVKSIKLKHFLNKTATTWQKCADIMAEIMAEIMLSHYFWLWSHHFLKTVGRKAQNHFFGFRRWGLRWISEKFRGPGTWTTKTIGRGGHFCRLEPCFFFFCTPDAGQFSWFFRYNDSKIAIKIWKTWWWTPCFIILWAKPSMSHDETIDF